MTDFFERLAKLLNFVEDRDEVEVWVSEGRMYAQIPLFQPFSEQDVDDYWADRYNYE